MLQNLKCRDIATALVEMVGYNLGTFRVGREWSYYGGIFA
jgi:hypothetical protein